ncbi:hypothetical protein FQR65_LT08551 [Abscondita terminalis]|nr:hypothetical protein FQR65_LT08551 [Abscondita terminalis]
MDKKLLEITKVEAIERDNQNKLIAVTQEIISLNKRTGNNDIQASMKDKELTSLKQECNNLRIDIELQKQILTGFQSKIDENERVLHDQTKILCNAQQNVWDTLLTFINENNHKLENGSLNNAREFIKKINVVQEIECLKTEVLQLEGKRYCRDIDVLFNDLH